VLHLLYSRFWHKVLFDCGLVSTDEPFHKLVNQGMVQSFAFKDSRGALVPVDEVEENAKGEFHRNSDGEQVERLVAKMSKALRNVINPDDVIKEYGADTLRLYEAFMGPVAASGPWNPRDLPGVHRFLQRIWRLFVPGEEGGAAIYPAILKDSEGDKDLERALHATIKKVGKDLEQMANNTAIAALMEFINFATKSKASLNLKQAKRFAVLLEPFAPHLAQNLWQGLGCKEELAYYPWPTFDETLLQADIIEIPVQVNGKLRAKIEIAVDAQQEAVEIAARKVAGEFLQGQVRKVVFVPGRMVNFVVTP
jgi:leucyl-tRNA synthetase